MNIYFFVVSSLLKFFQKLLNYELTTTLSYDTDTPGKTLKHHDWDTPIEDVRPYFLELKFKFIQRHTNFFQ